MKIRWYRRGVTAKSWNDQGITDRVALTPRGNLRVDFSISSAGGGDTRVMVVIPVEEFTNLFEMIDPLRQPEIAQQRLEIGSMRNQLLARTRTIQGLQCDMDLKDVEIARLQAENEKLNARILNESVKPDPVADFKERAIAALRELPLKQPTVVKLEEWLNPQPETDMSVYAEMFRA